ncbi:MAG: hypothetical protein JW763_01795 [candidate division Zixibacteria bacterium]|nr:hypothetical protein [candidate division Zixibacteria bacterium]
MNRTVLYWLSCLLILAIGALAADTDFEVGEIALSGENWGKQSATFTLKNVSMEMKTVIAAAETSFDDFDLTPIRKTRAVAFLQPEQTTDVTVPVTIPGNYGTCTIVLKIYDVVDTMDVLMDSQMLHTKTFSITYPYPAELETVVGEQLFVPPFVDRNDYYDHYFGRVMTYLLSRGKRVDEIAKLTGTTVDYVNAAIADFIDYGYLVDTPDGYRPQMMVIDDAQVKSIRSAIDGTVESLVEVITANIPVYDSSIAAMIADGSLTSDPDNIIDPGSVLHHKYPVILGLLMWDILGKNFVNDDMPFTIFEGSDPCNAEMGDFMYLVSGGAADAGTSFYYYLHTKKAERFHCGIDTMPIICDSRFRELRKAGKYVNWSFNRQKPSIFHTYTEDKVRGPLSLLMDGTFPHIEGLRQAVDDLAKSSGQSAYERGARLWCWSLVVTDVMRTLEKNGVVTIEGDGLYSMTKANLQR